ncbi:MAG: MFS transporter [Rhodospirillum sp.]|nr:MFS transporter [Rhodospirillum sp.]MCF8490419.1 MFS transporter [Rhodospirillum sp.]MCF8500984.1 MFS transporter [Rhodospirillum sp.]
MSYSRSRRTRPGLVLFALAMGGFAIGTTEFATMSLLPYFSVGLGIDAPTAGHVISAYALGVVVGAPVLAVMAARYPRWLILVVLMGLFALANGLSALAPTYEWMLFFRFLSGVPHGAYFGVASLVAVSVSPPGKRVQAVSRVMLGLTIATIIGVPVANAIGQWIGWRWGFAIVALLSMATVLLIALHAPRDGGNPYATPLKELDALRNRRVWMVLAIGAIGFGGMFAVYSYLASTLLEVTGVGGEMIPVVLAVFGLGMTFGLTVGSWAADKALAPSTGGVILWSIGALALYPLAAGQLWSLVIVVFLIGCGGALGPMLQTRLMDVAGDAQTLAAALNHSAFNTANALGPWLAGMAIAAGYGWTSTGWVGCALAVCGLVIWVFSLLLDRVSPQAPVQEAG